jgi:FlaA1/EpsC-like NDP-sugar epimerase
MYSLKYIKSVNNFFKDHKIFNKAFKDENKIFTGKKILITGGCGSVGSILAKKLLEFDIKKLVIIDNNEYSIYRFNRVVPTNKKLEIKFLSILNRDQLKKNFLKYNFDIVYNCAAIKHVDIAENNKNETYRVNVIGTKNIIDMCKLINIKQLIFISTDKAFYPKGVMGRTKLEAEKKILKFKKKKLQTKILRFPNVLFSSGSLCEILYECITKNKIFHLKNKKLKRYFIFQEDTVEFILRATDTLNVSNKIIVLKNVKETKILDLVIYLKKHFKLNYKVTKLPKFEKVAEIYSDFSSNKKIYI